MDNEPVYPGLDTLWYELDRLHDDDSATKLKMIEQLGKIIAELAVLEQLEQRSRS